MGKTNARLATLFVVVLLVTLIAAKRPGINNPDAPLPSKLLLAALTGSNPQASGVNGGTNCAACTLIVSLVEQLAYIHDKPLIKVMEGLCNQLPIGVNKVCVRFVDQNGQAIINLIELQETPDRVCQLLGVCTSTTCNLFPPPIKSVQERNKDIDWSTKIPAAAAAPGRNPLSWLDDFLDNHDPLFDLDGDKFSDRSEFRGYSWRGRDCDDLKKKIYPGRKNSTYSAEIDANCNGIYGLNSQKVPFEEELCSGTPYYGTAILGDSAAAHFHVPPSYITPSQINMNTYDDLIPILANEFDWPEMSSTTGYTDSMWEGHPIGPVFSSYLNGLNQNRCTFRDYQNIGVNGARTSSMASNIMYSFARDQENDYPVNLMYALIGNDVCNSHPGFSHMTTPDEFYTNVVKAMDYLDTVLPMGSHVVLMGLADGLVLWDAMNARIHPIGELRQDVTYADLYDYLNCLEISPCWGWMNSDPFARNETQRIANTLSDVYQQVINNNTYTHFDMTYIPCPVREMVDYWESQGGEAWQLIEPVDGFHPNQIGNALIANFVWEYFEKFHPELIPPLNPNNAKIVQLFGDQGGY